MKRLFRTLLLCTFFILTQVSALDQKAFAVVIPSYNNSEYYQQNLESVLFQNYDNYRIIYIDDASEDRNGELVQEYIRKNGLERRITFVQNRKREGALANVYRGIWLCAPNEIVVNLDGDDWLAHEHVLEKLNEVYSDPDVWVTYGQFVYYPCGSPGWAAQVPQYIIDKNEFRDYHWVTTALRTFYAGLFHKIKKEDLYYNGSFYFTAGDLAYMWPVLEMAGQHSRFIPDVLYVYNVGTPINDMKKDPELQRYLGLVTREGRRYQPINRPY